jgi:hypothetical protein
MAQRPFRLQFWWLMPRELRFRGAPNREESTPARPALFRFLLDLIHHKMAFAEVSRKMVPSPCSRFHVPFAVVAEGDLRSA